MTDLQISSNFDSAPTTGPTTGSTVDPTTATPTAPASADLADDSMVSVETTRFGTLEVGRDRIMYFPGGLLGFPGAERFALIQTGDDSYFFWLQSTQDPELAFVVCDPQAFVPGYTVDQIPLRTECREELGFADDVGPAGIAARTQVLTICNRVDDWLTGNLLGPLVINVGSFVGKQIVLTEKRWGTRQPLIRLGGEEPAGETVIDTSNFEAPLRKSA